MTLENKAEKQIGEMQKRAVGAGLMVSDLAKREYNYEFTVERDKQKVKIQVYFGKKGVKTVLQGDQNSTLYTTISSLVLDDPGLSFSMPKLHEPPEYIGTDECGKGDFFGPLVVAAVFVNEETRKLLLRSGVRDSKDLSDYQITPIAADIKKIIGDKYQIVKITPQKYNDLYEKFMNLNKLLNWAHSKAIDNLLDNTSCKYVITDKFSKKELDVVSLAKHSDVEFVQETKAEKYVGVAAASILARDSFVNWFKTHELKGMKLPKGSSLETERFAGQLFKKIGKEKLSEIAKLHFKTFQKIS